MELELGRDVELRILEVRKNLTSKMLKLLKFGFNLSELYIFARRLSFVHSLTGISSFAEQ